MRAYHEHLRVPAWWWPAGLGLVVLFGTELVAGLTLPLAAAAFGVLTVIWLVALWQAGRGSVDVADGELRAGKAQLPLAQAGEVAVLDEGQTRLLRGPRADPRAVVFTRPYLKRAVYIEISPSGQEVPYWLVGSRNPEALAAAIGKSRAGGPPAGLPVGGSSGMAGSGRSPHV